MTQQRFLAAFSLLMAVGLIIIACSQKPQAPPTYIDATSDLFTAAGTCANCHTAQDIQHQNLTLSTSTSWQASMMANAALDPYFQASVSKEISTHPEHREEIEDTCATCHMPMARTEDILINGQPGKILDNGYLNPDHPLFSLARDGVSCAVCHQIEDVNLNNELSFTGQFVVNAVNENKFKPSYGPFRVPPNLMNIMADASGYIPIQSPHIQTAELCATCHTLFTTPITPEGHRSDIQFPEQVPYLEWEASDYTPSISCQDCHMPDLTHPVRLTNIQGPFRTGYSSHTFTSANVFMMNVMQQNNEELGINATPTQLEEALIESTNFLSTQTLELSVTAAHENQHLVVDIAIQSLSGHKFPSGYPSRRAWIHLTALDADGEIIFESGAFEPDGNILGNANDEDPLAYEPHYEIITSADQVQIYESIMIDSDRNVTTELLAAVTYIKDNRLLPSGFDKNRVFEMIAVQGNALADPNFVGGGDMITYQINMSEGIRPVRVIVEILFQPVSFRWIENFRRVDATLVTDFLRFVDTARNQFAVIASQTVEVASEP